MFGHWNIDSPEGAVINTVGVATSFRTSVLKSQGKNVPNNVAMDIANAIQSKKGFDFT